MHSTAEDAVSIGSSSSTYEASSRGRSTENEPSSPSVDARRHDAAPASWRHPATAAAATHKSTVDHLQRTFEAVVPPRPSMVTQTDTAVSESTAAALHRHLMALDEALGIKAAPSQHCTVPPASGAVRALAASWRSAAQQWKRRRSGEGDVTAAATRAKAEPRGGAGAVTAASLASAAPAWATAVCAALEQTGELLHSTALAEAERGDRGAESYRAQLAAEVASTPWSSRMCPPEDCLSPLMKGDTPRPPQGTDREAVAADGEAAQSLLREAEVICAREQQPSLLPIYTELYTLRRLRAQRQREESREAAQELQWEQRMLADVLAECEGQLAFLSANLVECCRSGLAPLDALQQRMAALDHFRRQVQAAESATVPVAAARQKERTGVEGPVERAVRPIGRAAGVVRRHLEEERRQQLSELAAAQEALRQQRLRTAEIEACYAHATAQVQQALDAQNFVDKGAIVALKRQQREELEGLALQFGWSLVNSTTDVLSLRHPASKEVLHVNHAYSTINGRPCDNAAMALAEYVVRHAASKASAAAVPSGVAALPPKAEPAAASEREGAAPEAQLPAAVPPPSLDPTAAVEHPPLPSARSASASSTAQRSSTETDSEGGGSGGSADSRGSSSSRTASLTAASVSSAEGSRSEAVAKGMAPGDAKAGYAADPALDLASATASPSSPLQHNTETSDDYSFLSDEDEELAAAVEEDREGKEEASAESTDGGVESPPADTRAAASGTGEVEFVDYSNLQSDEPTEARDTQSSAVQSAPAASRASGQTLPSFNSTVDKSEPQGYIGFFTENALWEDDR